jgi:hypothetical protein
MFFTFYHIEFMILCMDGLRRRSIPRLAFVFLAHYFVSMIVCENGVHGLWPPALRNGSGCLLQSLLNEIEDGCQVVIPLYVAALFICTFWTVAVVTSSGYAARIQAAAAAAHPRTPAVHEREMVQRSSQ